MAYFSNPVVKVGAAIGSIADITAHVTSAELMRELEALEDTTFANSAREYESGLENNSASITAYLSYEASTSLYAILSPLVGTKCVLKVNPAAGSDSSTNPGFILTNTYLSSLPVINKALGELQSVTIEFQGGSYSVDTTA